MVNVVGVVIHHVENDTNSCLVQCLYHLLELTDAAGGVIWVRRVATLGHIIVHRVIAPVILRLVQARLIHRPIVITRQNVNGIHAQFLQVLNGPRLRQCQELAFVLCVSPIDREVTVMHLIYNKVSRRLGHRVLVTLPPCRADSLPVDDGTTAAVHADSLGKHAWAFTASHVERIELAHPVTLHRSRPQVITRPLHLDALQHLFVLAVLVQAYQHLLRIVRCKQLKRGLFWRVGHLVKGEILCVHDCCHH